MLNGTFANEANAKNIVSIGQLILRMNHQGVGAFKTQIFNVIDEYISINRRTEARQFKASELRKVLYSPIANNVPAILEQILPLILMDQANRGMFTAYSKKSLYVMLYKLLEHQNVFKLTAAETTPADNVNKLLDLCLQMGVYSTLCEKLVLTLQDAQHDYEFWFNQPGSRFVERCRHGEAGQIKAKNFILQIKSKLTSIDIIEMLRLLRGCLQNGPYRSHSFNTYLVKHLYLGSANGELMHTQSVELNEEFNNNVREWINLILSELNAVRQSRQPNRVNRQLHF